MSFAGNIAKRPIGIGLGVAVASHFFTGGESTQQIKNQLNTAFATMVEAKQDGGALDAYETMLAEGAGQLFGQNGYNFFKEHGTEATMLGAGALALANKNTRGYGLIMIAGGIALMVANKSLSKSFNDVAPGDDTMNTSPKVARISTEEDAPSFARTEVAEKLPADTNTVVDSPDETASTDELASTEVLDKLPVRTDIVQDGFDFDNPYLLVGHEGGITTDIDDPEYTDELEMNHE